MNLKFYQQIFARQQAVEAIPSNEGITGWALQLAQLLFPEQSNQGYLSVHEIEEAFKNLEHTLATLLNATQECEHADNESKAKVFFGAIPELYRILNTDIHAIVYGDPAARSEFEVIRCYPGFYAIAFYRIAHALLKLDIPLLPRILTEHAHSQTGIDIHPAAEIGEYLCIDHGTGIVIGETCRIGNHVKLYQSVTLGALSVDKSMAHMKRHPDVEDYVIIYSGATILGGETVIGHHSVIGGNVWITKSVPPYSNVYHRPNIDVTERKMQD